MYFLNDNERKKLLKSYLPKSREQGVSEELRGWNWHQPPLEYLFETRLPLYQIAGKYCSSGRDVYLNRVHRVKPVPNDAMKKGLLFHELIVKILVRTKKLIYLHGVSQISVVLEELPLVLTEFKDRAKELNIEDENLDDYMEQIYNYEYYRISSRLQEILSLQPYINEDSLASLTIPFVLEQRLDGNFLGLSSNLSTDAFVFSEPMIIDLKFGKKEKFHHLTTTGYALVMESLYEYPINIGCIVYGEFKNGRLHVKKDIHIINDELRQWFVEERDEKSRIVYDELDPGKADNCYDACPYICHCE
ncbi:MAG: type I-A CRISPR-associated protein Cas4/Csa1 [Firmicutes bacterium HGW-Firmicutes-13]|nr:MAG: type I-A CRISPR-associated protein Cas4/Csa1 [Firmicutes bacterium HGW-Firmicutes-13]